MKTKNLTIMFTDIKWFTEKTSTYSRQQINDFLFIQSALFEPIITEFNGTIIKTIWDAYLLAFESPTDAVLCWIKAQEAIEKHNTEILHGGVDLEKEFHIRIWINTGEVNVINGDVFWETVNIASRIESIAEANEIYFTQSVYLSMNKNEIPTASVWYRHLKWIPEEIKIYKVLKETLDIKAYHSQRQYNAIENGKINKEEETDSIKEEKKDHTGDKTTNRTYIFMWLGGLFIVLIFYIFDTQYFLQNKQTVQTIEKVIQNQSWTVNPEAEEQIILKYKNENFPKIQADIYTLLDTDILFEVDWDILKVKESSNYLVEWLDKVYFLPIINALNNLCSDENKKIALKKWLKKIHITNSDNTSNPVTPFIAFKNGTLYIDQRLSNLDYEFEDRVNLIVLALEILFSQDQKIVTKKTNINEKPDVQNSTFLGFETKKEFIFGHYKMLEKQDFENAIANYDDVVIENKKLSKELLKKWYENTFDIYVLEFNQVKDNEFIFKVKVKDKDLKTITYYKTIMILREDDRNWKLKINSYESKLYKKETNEN